MTGKEAGKMHMKVPIYLSSWLSQTVIDLNAIRLEYVR